MVPRQPPFPSSAAAPVIEDQLDAAENVGDAVAVEPADRIGQIVFVDREELRHVGDAVPGRFPAPIGNNTLPGASARRRFVVKAHTTTVASRLRLKRSF